MDGRATRFDDCVNEPTSLVQITILTPVVVNCDHYRIRIKVANGSWTLDAEFLAKYCRTWMDFDAAGQCRQRWRFLLNADVTFLYGGTNPPLLLPGFVPNCVASSPSFRPHYTGHLDYVCTGSPQEPYAAALELHHLPGCISHASCAQPPASTVSFKHLQEGFHIAGPLPFSFADPGVIGSSPPGPGFVFPFLLQNQMLTPPGDTLRESRFPWSSYQCLNESRLGPNGFNTFGDQPGFEFCNCDPMGTGNPIEQRRFVFADLFANFDCSEASSAALTLSQTPVLRCGGPLGPFATISNPGLVVMRVGGWSGGYFDGEYVYVIFGRVDHTRYHWSIAPPPGSGSCSTVPLDPAYAMTANLETFVHGVITKCTGGQFGRLEPFYISPGNCSQYVSPRYDRFLDMANMFIAAPLGAPDIDGYGVEFYSWAVWSLNPNALP